MTLKDLNNPEKVTAILLKNGTLVTLSQNQGFQIYPKSCELWENNKGLFRLRRWLDKSIIAYYS